MIVYLLVVEINDSLVDVKFVVIRMLRRLVL